MRFLLLLPLIFGLSKPVVEPVEDNLDVTPVYIIHTYCDKHQDHRCITAGGLVGVVLEPTPMVILRCNGGPHDYKCDTKTHGEWVGVIVNPVKH